MASSLRELALTVLEGGTLEAKLCSVRTDEGALLPDHQPGPRVVIDEPRRAADLGLSDERQKLPALGALADPAKRALCLERFAHHELMAVELFAWALLAFPDAPAGLRRGMALALEEEQQHLELYQARLHAHGGRLGDRPLNGYFWHVLPTDEEATLTGFLAGQGLTLEQANLDFTLMFRDAFAQAGDQESAEVMQRVHDDEIGHVKLACTWFKKLVAPRGLLDAYPEEVVFPLAAARAKGRRFAREPRLQAGLDEPFVDYVEAAKPYGR